MRHATDQRVRRLIASSFTMVELGWSVVFYGNERVLSMPQAGCPFWFATLRCKHVQPNHQPCSHCSQRCCQSTLTHRSHHANHHARARLPQQTGGIQNASQQVLASTLLDKRSHLQKDHQDAVTAPCTSVRAKVLRTTAGAVIRANHCSDTRCRVTRQCSAHRPATGRSSDQSNTHTQTNLCCHRCADVCCRTSSC